MLNSDYRDMLSELSAARAEFLLVGAYALATYGLVRATSDIDLWVRATPDNAQRVFDALVAFGAPSEHFSLSFLSTQDQVLQIGVDPVRIDILTGLSGLDFGDAWERRETVELEGLSIPVLSLLDLATNKRTTARKQDLADLEWIEDRI